MNTAEDIQIANIESELSSLHEKQKSLSLIPACLFNLVIYSEFGERNPDLQQIIPALIAKFPCRIILIQENKDQSQNYLRVSVSTERVGDVVCDQILIEATSQYLNRVPFIILPNLVPDLPLHLLWGQDPTTDTIILPQLISWADRLIFDMSNEQNPKDFSSHILKLMSLHPHIDFVDINWILINGWRKVLKQVFNSPASIQQLQQCASIQITYNNRDLFPDNRIQSLYLLTWLASQLGWTIQEYHNEKGSYQFTCQESGNEFTAMFLPEIDLSLNPGTVLALDISSRDDHFFTISPVAQLPKVVVHTSSLDTCRIPFTLPLSSLKPGCYYVKELFMSPASDHYKSMLKNF